MASKPVGGHVGTIAHLPEDPERHLLVDHVVLGEEDPERVAGGHLRIELAPRRARCGTCTVCSARTETSASKSCEGLMGLLR